MLRLRSVRALSVLVSTPLALSALACGAAPAPLATPPTATATARTDAPSAPGSASALSSAPGRRLPSQTVLRYWPFDAPPSATLFADLSGLLHTDLGSSLLPAVLTVAHGALSDAEAQCLRGAASAVKELAFGADASGAGMLVATFDDKTFDPAPCLQAQGAAPVQLAGAQHAFALSDSLLVLVPGALLAGTEPSIKRALGAQAPSPTFPAELALGPSEFVAWSATIDQNALHGTLLASSERFRLGVEANVPEADAKDAEQAFLALQQKKLQLPGLKGPEAEMFLKLLQSVALQRTGSHLSAAFDLHEPPAEQARDLGMLTALSVYGVRKYLLAAKVAEAKETVFAIASRYSKTFEPPPGKTPGSRKLVSLPPVPALVPKGSKYQSTAADWKPWQAIGFKLDDAQYYQYEVRAAKDGHSADIVARGDLDADGKLSEFRIHLTRTNQLAVPEQIEAQDPEE